MMRLLPRILFALTAFVAIPASALVTEVGVNYARKRTSFNADNYVDSESLTGSLSFYFMERLALELSYTSALGVRQEKLMSGTTVISDRTVVQTTQVIGGDLIWVFADRRATLQPYIKGGAAQIRRVQEVKDSSFAVNVLEPEVSVVPSYGAGLKISITERLGIKLSYDAWRTPMGDDSFSTDDSIRAGITWML